jgi:hypothetical protein
MDKYQVTLTFTEPLLGTAPLNTESYDEWIRSNHPDTTGEDELETVEEAMEKGMTGFHRLDGAPIIYDYQIKGFFKDACSMMRRVKDSKSSKVTAHKKIIDGLVFVHPRRIPLAVVGEIDKLQRPLRAQTAQGERVALACSEMVAAGSSMSFTVTSLDGVSESLLREWLDYGELRGLGQWRNASYGRFTYELTPA